MAKGLIIGDTVAVREKMRLPRKDPAYQAGLRTLTTDMHGKVVAEGEGRSVVVEFNGIQTTLASQRLNKIEAPAPEETSGLPKRRGRKAAGATSVAAKSGATLSTHGLVDYQSTAFLKTAANKLLSSGGETIDPDTVLVQIKLSDLPDQVRDQIQQLMQAKLALEPQGTPAPAEPKQPGRRGRKPKAK